MKTTRQCQALVFTLLTFTAAAQPLTKGEVRRVDKEAAKLTLRHGRIENLDMPPMKMVFRVASPSLLDGLKDGDRVRFAAEKIGGLFTGTTIEPAKWRFGAP